MSDIRTVNYTEGVDAPNQDLHGMIARSVIVDNHTQSWAYVPSAQRYVRPLAHGVVLVLAQGTSIGGIVWQTPPGLNAATLGNGTLTAQWNSDVLPPSEGVSVYAQQSQPQFLGSAAPNVNNIYPIPSGTLAIGIMANGATISLYGCDARGNTTRAYINQLTTRPGRIVTHLIDPQDSYINVQTPAGSANTDVWAYPFAPPVDFDTEINIYQQPTQVIGASSFTAGTLITIAGGTFGTVWKGSVGVAVRNSTGVAGSGLVRIGATSSASVLPPIGTILAGVTLLSTGTSGTSETSDVYVKAPAGGSAVIESFYDAPVAGFTWVNGVYLPQ